MKNPRISVTLNQNDAEVIQLICQKKGVSQSALVKKVLEDWLEEYEDMQLAKRAEEVEKKWIAGGCKTISHGELWKNLDTE
ncbi:MAG: DUF6290 family protein [Chloroherpetonaceae bacterium]